MALHGKSTIRLFDADTGKERERVQDSNIITNAISKILNPPLDYAYKSGWIKIANTISPIQTVGMGGILIWGDTITEDANIVVPPAGITPIGHAGDEYTGANPARGSYNSAESGAIEGGYRHVWDFATDRANGTIKCLSLTSKNGGNSGLTVGSDNIAAFADLGYVTQTLSSDSRSYRRILGDISRDRWAALDLSNGNLEYYSNFDSSQIGLETTYDHTTSCVDVISPGFTDFSDMNNNGIYSVSDSAVLWLALKKSNRNVWLASVNLLTGEKLSEVTIQLANADGYSQTNFSVCGVSTDYLYIAAQATNPPGGGTKYRFLRFDHSGVYIGEATPDYYSSTYSDCFRLNGEFWLALDMRERVRVEPVGDTFPKIRLYDSRNIPLYSYRNSAPLYAIYSSASSSHLESRLQLFYPYLASINNLAKPVTKTPAQTMKITYEITEE